MSGLALLSGYGSDSESDDAGPSIAHQVASNGATTAAAHADAKPSSSGLASKLPPPSSVPSSSKSSSSGLSLPPPTAAKRKVIKIDSLPSVNHVDDGEGSDAEDGNMVDTKKPRLGAASTSKHSLFGMLPAPKRKDDEVLAERRKEAQARKADKLLDESDPPSIAEAPLRIVEEPRRSVSPERSTDDVGEIAKPKGKTNDAFRAMLGLKPAAKKLPAPTSDASATLGTKADSVTADVQQQSTVRRPAQSNTATSTVDAAPVDFFSLHTPSSHANRTASANSSTSLNPAHSVSAAPAIELSQKHESQSAAQEPDESYPGWALDPDGSWVPITPEAQARFLAYQASLAPSTSSSSRGASNLDGTRDLLAAGLTPDDIASFDAASAARNAYLQNGDGDGADSDKYAMAAEFAAGNRDAVVQQRKPGMVKGLRKGQLSSLISLAEENRGKLEERWQRGREAQAKRSSRYGW